MNSWIDLDALWKIVVIGLLCGAGLPAVFAVGLRALSLPGAGSRSATMAAEADGRIVGGSPLGLAGAGLCFAIVLTAIGWGIYSIVAGT